ncbi:hypothetical protein [Brumimicrobium oceani]|uniref:Uncharacterized protein n=1 Tax=Brumimicrobium oceani TaxID=2100725 RepID=A0A2U2XAQ9_9FLAO|nr:hypothetical protein [Brumimicrobium oceani]PWH84878.1 hypothetical protein DIT68_12090 [Brumimicrobium oceani]
MTNSNTKIIFPRITFFLTAIVLSYIVFASTSYSFSQIEIHQESYIKTDTLDKDFSTSNPNLPKNAVQEFKLTRSNQE